MWVVNNEWKINYDWPLVSFLVALTPDIDLVTQNRELKKKKKKKQKSDLDSRHGPKFAKFGYFYKKEHNLGLTYSYFMIFEHH